MKSMNFTVYPHIMPALSTNIKAFYLCAESPVLFSLAMNMYLILPEQQKNATKLFLLSF